MKRYTFVLIVSLAFLIFSALHAPLLYAETKPPALFSPITALAFSPDGTHLAVGTLRTALLLDVRTGREVARLGGHAGAITSLAFRPDGRLLAVAGGSPGKFGEIKLWNVGTGKLLKTLTGHADVIYGIAFRRDGQRIAAGSYDRLVSIWNPSGGTPKMLKDHTDAVYGVAYSPDGTRIASVAGDRTLKIWDAESGKRVYTLSESTAELFCVAFRPDGRQLTAGGADKTLRTWTVTPTSGSLVKSAFAHQAAILSVVYAPDGNTVLTTGEDSAVKRWNALTLAEEYVYPRQPDTPHALALTASGLTLAVGRHNGSLALYNTSSGKLLYEPLKGTSAVLRTIRALCQQSSELKEKPTGGPTLFTASLGAMSPTGLQRGKSGQFTFFGGKLNHAKAIWFDDAGLQGKIVMPPDPNEGVLRVDITSTSQTRIGLHSLIIETPNGTTGSLTFAVGDWQEIPQKEPNETLQTAQVITLPSTLVGAIEKPGDVDVYRFDAKAGEEIVFDVLAQPLRSRLQPVLTLLDGQEKTLAESTIRSGRADTYLGYRFAVSGTYYLRVRDFQNQSGGDVTYRINAGNLAFVTRAFPLGVEKGTTSEVQLEGFNLGVTRKVHVQAPPKETGDKFYTLSTVDGKPMQLYGAAQIALGDDAETLQKKGNESLGNAQSVPFPVTINGRLWDGTPNPKGRPISHYFRFSAKKGQKVVLETLARRRGSALDTMIEVLDKQGRPIEQVVLRAVGQTEITLNDRDSFSTGMRIINWDDFHIGDYIMVGREVARVVALPEGPDNDIQYRNYRGRRLGYYGTTPEFHTVGASVYKVEVHPAGSHFSPNGYPLTRLNYQNDDGNALFDKDSYLEFTPPADDEYTVRLTDARGQQGEDYPYRLMIRTPHPDFKVSLSPFHPNIPQGGGAVVNVECERYDGFDGAIDLKLINLPIGFTATTTTIEAGEVSARILITAHQSMAGSLRKFCVDTPMLVATAKVEGKERVQTLPSLVHTPLFTVLPNPDLSVTTDRHEATLRPGGETTLEVTVSRKGKYGRRVPVDVRNLPFGVRVMNVGLNGVLVRDDEIKRKFTLFCEPWVKPQTRSIYVTGEVEGGVGNTALPITLKVEGARK
ncbi:MAG: pre-peptidase C-terminal domain-containing protein [Armatimonadetes bacterium]|nr:pre-peptidase C-terminal domain-containing protein [Armatimonadota bacterium]